VVHYFIFALKKSGDMFVLDTFPPQCLDNSALNQIKAVVQFLQSCVILGQAILTCNQSCNQSSHHHSKHSL